MALNERQKLFVKEYLVDKNATRAAIASGYSAKTATKIGSENLTKPDIAEAIQSVLNKTHEKLEITVERIQEELAKMAFQDMSAEELHGLRYADKKGALELLGKNKAMFTDKVDMAGSVVVRINNPVKAKMENGSPE